MAAADALSLGGYGGDPKGVFRWIAGGTVALALHGGLLLYLRNAPAPHAFDNQQAIEIDMAPPPTPAGAEAPAEQASEAQPEELPEITPDEVTPPDEVETVETETPLDEIVETPPETAVAVEQVETIETPPDIQAAVTLPPEQTVTAREEEVTPPPTPKPMVKREPPKPKPVVKREEPKPVQRQPPKPNAVRGETARQAQAGSRTPSAASAGRQGATSGNPDAARAAAAAYGGRVRSAVNATKSCVSGVNGRAVVRFTVSRAGRVMSVSASGSGPVAAAATAMVRRAAIPPMPAAMPNPSASYSLPISLNQC